MDADIIDQLEDWKIPEEFHQEIADLIEEYGDNHVASQMEYRTTPYDRAAIDEWKKYVIDTVLFKCKSWNYAWDVISHAFDLQQGYWCGLFDEDEIFKKIEDKKIVYFDHNSKKEIIFIRGCKITESQIERLKEGKEYVRKNNESWKRY